MNLHICAFKLVGAGEAEVIELLTDWHGLRGTLFRRELCSGRGFALALIIVIISGPRRGLAAVIAAACCNNPLHTPLESVFMITTVYNLYK